MPYPAEVPEAKGAPEAEGAPPPERAMKATHDERVRGAYAGLLVQLEGGAFLMGTDDEQRGTGGVDLDGEGPIRPMELGPFAIAAHAVTTSDFNEFVQTTGYLTIAERDGWSFVFAGRLAPDHPPTRAVAAAPWWRQVMGASWHAPDGPGSTWRDRPDHPAVHVSWDDAMAYCAWASVRLPTETEWEYAARGGLVRCRYPWGDEVMPHGEQMCNIFEGEFPEPAPGVNVGTAAVDAFGPNGFGLCNVSGNVWEWCADRFGASVTGAAASSSDEHVIRGGSYMCHDSYCNRYRVGARSRNTADSTVGNLGFRVAAES
jgi:formylglycine-generating enzyme